MGKILAFQVFCYFAINGYNSIVIKMNRKGIEPSARRLGVDSRTKTASQACKAPHPSYVVKAPLRPIAVLSFHGRTAIGLFNGG